MIKNIKRELKKKIHVEQMEAQDSGALNKVGKWLNVSIFIFILFYFYLFFI